ncbi:DUF6461 domain-containing protein [Streptomyces sp. LHD-70]|uniref:DUF6461 domain-containing protein n=1 Tax=Streptomyces sp. LHD-70 TaxID=3072140 RepID=UPI00280E3D89|nr:DUF6461 domain-containing protein [Streptomyces sp. LHD-70]MDQ8704786.1 DUF6461 domain-containing protein [Streptomyces sp. LHD-70]
MTELTGNAGGRLWQWLHEYSELGHCLTLSRGLTADDVMRAYDVDPATAAAVTIEGAYEIEPEDDDESDAEGSVVRFGHSRGWGFSVEQLGSAGGYDPVLSRLSAGTETVALTYTGDGMTWVTHSRDGVLLSSFEPLMPSLVRHGTGPHELADLVQAFMDAQGGEWDLDGGPSPDRIMLGLVEERFGCCPSPTVLDGRLPTAYVRDEEPWS